MVSRFNWRTILSVAFAVLALGCTKAPNVLDSSTSKTIFFFTKDFRFYDLGFIKSYTNYTSLEIFNAGVALLKMDCYENTICLNAKCYAKDSIMRRFFGSDTFNDLDFRAILKGQEIFDGENKIMLLDGFQQSIGRAGLTLDYQVTNAPSITLRVKDLQQHTLFSLSID